MIGKYNQIALEDFEYLHELFMDKLKNKTAHSNELLISDFVKERCVKRFIFQKDYIKYILPLLNKIIGQYNNNAQSIGDNSSFKIIESKDKERFYFIKNISL